MGISDTEKLNENTVNIDVSQTIDVVKMINNEDFNAVRAVENCLPEIAAAVDIISENFKNGGRLIYFGAGTSGRLGVLDASPEPFLKGADLIQMGLRPGRFFGELIKEEFEWQLQGKISSHEEALAFARNRLECGRGASD